MQSDTVKVVQLKVGDTETKDIKLGSAGYMLKRGDNVVAFYLDAWTNSGRAYPVSTSNCTFIPETKEVKNYPSLHFDNSAERADDLEYGEVYFPEFEGWSVFSVTGGKTMSICLIKD